MLLALLALANCRRNRPAITSWSEQQEAVRAVEDFKMRTLAPARIPKPGVAPGPFEVMEDGVTGVATLVRPEDAAWNQWGEEGLPLLFNNRVALLFEIDLTAPGELHWRPQTTVLEVNDPGDPLVAVPSSEHLLADLSWYALQQEKWLLEGDLVQRTRHAGAFRQAFLKQEEGRLHGVIGFVPTDPEQHIGALRLTLSVEHQGAERELVWVFQ